MRWRGFWFGALTLILGHAAGADSSGTAQAVQANRMRVIENQCFRRAELPATPAQRAKGRASLKTPIVCADLRAPSEEKYRRQWHSGVQETVLNSAFMNAVNFTSAVTKYTTAAVSCPLDVSSAVDAASPGRRVREALAQRIRRLSERWSLTECQQACLVTCVSANLLSFKEGVGSKFSSTDALFTQEYGECTEFAELATTLGRDVGLKMSPVIGKGHAFVSLEWVSPRGVSVLRYLEPQSPACEFMQPE